MGSSNGHKDPDCPQMMVRKANIKAGQLGGGEAK